MSIRSPKLFVTITLPCHHLSAKPFRINTPSLGSIEFAHWHRSKASSISFRTRSWFNRNKKYCRPFTFGRSWACKLGGRSQVVCPSDEPRSWARARGSWQGGCYYGHGKWSRPRNRCRNSGRRRSDSEDDNMRPKIFVIKWLRIIESYSHYLTHYILQIYSQGRQYIPRPSVYPTMLTT